MTPDDPTMIAVPLTVLEDISAQLKDLAYPWILYDEDEAKMLRRGINDLRSKASALNLRVIGLIANNALEGKP